MTGHLAVTHAVAFVERHGYALLFWWVLAEQGAIPLPSVPLLLAAGALIRTGRLNGLLAVGCCISAALIADTTWFLLGRSRGRRVLRLLCRFSLEPDSCVRTTENAFLKYGMYSLLISKFVPGLNAVAAPLAGDSRRSYGEFLLYDACGASIWTATYLGLGCIFSEQLETAFDYASRMGSGLLVLVIALFVLWIGWKFIQRRRFLKELIVARITPEELGDRLKAGEDLFIVDLRNRRESDGSIPGATRFDLEDLAGRTSEIPRDREIILFCS
jgi:membrane protein DedA with SNARE-associated domain